LFCPELCLWEWGWFIDPISTWVVTLSKKA
jgi:hypothetical protein